MWRIDKEVGILRNMLSVIVLTVMGLWLRAQEPGFHLEGMISRSLPVTGRKMTNIIFPVDIAAGVRVSRDVLVQKVKGVENVMELKALKREFPPTNLAVYGKDGRLYSFVLHYVEDTAVLDYRVVRDSSGDMQPVRFTGWPADPDHLREDGRTLAAERGFLHRKATADGLRIKLKGLYLRDSLFWLAIELWDRTVLGCRSCSLRTYTEDRKRIKRTASQEVEINPVLMDGVGPVPGGSRKVMVVALRPLMVGRGRRLVIRMQDEAGERQVVLKVKGRVLGRVRRI